MKRLNIGVTFFVFCISMVAIAVAADTTTFSVPHLDGIVVDGDPADWGDSGFRVDIMTGEDGKILPADDLDASFRLGWDNQGLLLLLTVDDNSAVEFSAVEELWYGDLVTLFVATERGSSERYLTTISPGLDPKYPELRSSIQDFRETPGEELSVEAARSRTETGYVLEVSLPWKNLAIEPKSGREIAFQIYVNDSDDVNDDKEEEKVFRSIWYPRSGAIKDTYAMYSLLLADSPSLAVVAAAGGGYERMKHTRVSVYATADLAGMEMELRDGNVTLASGKLTADAGRAGGDLIAPMPPLGKSYGELAVVMGDRVIATPTLPDADKYRARALIDAEIHFQPAVFTGETFPSCDFERPLWAEALMGQYELKTTFYDNQYNQVTSAEKPGRYGAIIEITPEHGRAIRRFRTLFREQREPDEKYWQFKEIDFSVTFPPEMGIDPAVAAEQADAISNHLKARFADGFWHDDNSAALMAGLYEMKPGKGEITVANDVWAEGREWWVGLKRKFYGTGEAYPDPFVCPKPVDGEPAPTLREGTLAEAGMKPDAADNIDAVCQVWAADSDQPFAVCIARHGVIILHKAYGEHGGRPMTVDDRTVMASITKLLSGTLMMMVVDQGLVALDDRVDKFIPALRDIDVKTPLTIRHLYTHTNGLWGHWGDDRHDFEELIASYYPYLDVGVRHAYNGAGYAMGGKVLEAVSGEGLPQFYQRHMLEPLGCTNTYVTDTSVYSLSIPLDMAKIGQMLLNRGKYGDKQFFSEETFQKMLPVKLTKALGPNTKIEWGIGTTWSEEPGLDKGTFGHGAASSATFRIDPVNDLVIVMNRNGAGSNFGKYYPQFIAAIVEGLE